MTVRTAHLKLMAASTQIRLLPGRLYRVPLNGDQSHVADVSDRGELDQPYECAKGDRLVAVPAGALYTGDNRSKPCRDAVEFEYSATYTVSLERSVGTPDLAFGHYLEAYSDYSTLYWEAVESSSGAARTEYLVKARASETSVLTAVAMALGDYNLDQFVMRDPTQGYRLALTRNGVFELQALQRKNNLPVTGRLDFATVRLIGQSEVPPPIVLPSGYSLTLPDSWANDTVVETSDRQSLGLRKLQLAKPKR